MHTTCNLQTKLVWAGAGHQLCLLQQGARGPGLAWIVLHQRPHQHVGVGRDLPALVQAELRAGTLP